MSIQKYLNYLQLLKIKAMTVLENLSIGKTTERSWVQKLKILCIWMKALQNK